MPGLIVYLKYLTAIGVCLFGVGLPFRLGGGCFVRDLGCLGMRFQGVILWFKSRAGARDPRTGDHHEGQRNDWDYRARNWEWRRWFSALRMRISWLRMLLENMCLCDWTRKCSIDSSSRLSWERSVVEECVSWL